MGFLYCNNLHLPLIIQILKLYSIQIPLMVMSRKLFSRVFASILILLITTFRYVDEKAARSNRLIAASDYASVYIGVDHSSVLSPAGPGRKSVRITSQKSWTHGLFVAEISHMPGGICGTWPACKITMIV